MRVLLVLSKRTTGGTAQLARQWTECLVAAGAHVEVVTLQGGATAGRDAPALESLKKEGYAVQGLGHGGIQTGWRTVARLRRVIKDFNPNAVHTFFPLAEAYSVLATRGLGIPVFGTIVSAKVRAKQGSRVDFYRRWFRNSWVTAWIAVGETVRRSALATRFPRDRVHMVYPGLDVSSIIEQSREVSDDLRWRRNENEFLVVTVGRLVESKGHQDVIRAIALLPSNYCLLVVGSGPYEPQLRNLSRELSVQDRVHFLGVRADVPHLIATADVYVTCTRFEGLAGYTTLEAAVVGTPIIATDIPEIREVFGGLPVALVTPGDIEQVAFECKSLSMKKSRDSEVEVQAHIRSLFDPATIGEKLLQVYRQYPGNCINRN